MDQFITIWAQSDRPTEVVNRTLETYLRCYCADSQKDWNMYLFLAEWWYNTTFHSAIQTSPYEALYGQQPPTHLPYLPGEAVDEEVDINLIAREFKTQLLRFHLDRAQQRMTDMANKHRSDRQFQEGYWVYLQIQPYRQTTLSNQTFNKLSAKYFGPYQVIQRIGKVAYKLSLPTHVAVHATFHVSQLKPCYAFPEVLNHPPLVDIASPYCVEPDQVLDRKTIKRGNKVIAEILVQWKDIPSEQATWEDFAKTTDEEVS
ncbi:hypothetical protein KY290_000785 [Solanum tuberosum]|uniref:Tf2-1-like SH3-like domain-containing protein n=1 Tax=Solanum tuberosum TaxID=4113 RepID=A0ABQ7WMI6_SOLTU|nr:hypothetical protein KY289_000854 [Solanum tuberosum]KAH0781187.1 hypothetical protein KY290_000785 [Solanum tuberosum]